MSHTPRQNSDWRMQLIRSRMARTRCALAEKIDLLGQRARGAAKVVENVTETVEETVSTVQSVAEVFDVQRHPLLMLGGAVAAGYLGGLMLERLAVAPWPQPTFGPAHPYANALPARSAPHSETGPGWTQQLAGVLGTEVGRIKRQAVGAAVGAARDLLAPQIPEPVRPFWRDLTRKLTVWLGGDPIPGPVLPTDNSRSEHNQGDSHAECNGPEMAGAMGSARRQGQTGVGQTHG